MNEEIIVNHHSSYNKYLFLRCINSSNVLRYLDKEDIINLSKASKLMNSFVNNNNLLILNIIENNQQYQVGKVLYQKDFYFRTVNQKVIEEIAVLALKSHEQFLKQNSSLFKVYVFTFLILFIDITSFFIAISNSNNNVFKSKKEKNWVIIMATILEWLITIGFFIHFKFMKSKLKKDIKNYVKEKKNSFKFYTKEREDQIVKVLKLQGRYYKNSFYENTLISIILIFSPFVIKIFFFDDMSYKSIFSISTSLFYGLNMLYDLYKIIMKKIRQKKYNQELLNNKIQTENSSIEIPDSTNNNSNSLENNNKKIYERNKKMKSILGENYLNIAFMVTKCILKVLFILYFTKIGEKLDDKANSFSWVIIFVPCYICFLPILLFCILHCFSIYSIVGSKIPIFIITISLTYLFFFTNSIIIPLKLENKINFQLYLIAILFAFGTLFLILHLWFLHIFKKNQ